MTTSDTMSAAGAIIPCAAGLPRCPGFAGALVQKGLAVLDGNPGYEAVPPFEFVGIATVTQESPGWDVPQVAEEARFLDANGRSV